MAMAPSAADTELTAGVACWRKRTRLRKTLENASLWRGLFALVMFVLLWELGARMKDLTGITLPFIGFLPPPSAVAKAGPTSSPSSAIGRAGIRALHGSFPGSCSPR